MIDIKKAEEEFKKFSKKYDQNEYKISMKYYHTFRVEEICGGIATLLGLNEEKIKLAKLIGLLHDIARFEQYTIYKTYNDLISIDHADLAVEILKKDEYLRKYIEANEYDDIILKAIKYHNKYSIGKDVNEEEKLFCEIVRDADKLDIFHISINESLEFRKDEIEEELITNETYEQFMSKEIVDRKNVKNEVDRVVVLLAFIYDFNFYESYKIINEKNYINRSIDLFNFKEHDTISKIEKIRKIANDYIEEQIKNN